MSSAHHNHGPPLPDMDALYRRVPYWVHPLLGSSISGFGPGAFFFGREPKKMLQDVHLIREMMIK